MIRPRERSGLSLGPGLRALPNGPDVKNEPRGRKSGNGVTGRSELRETGVEEPDATSRMLGPRGLVKGRRDLDQPLEQQADRSGFREPGRLPDLVRFEESSSIEEDAPPEQG